MKITIFMLMMIFTLQITSLAAENITISSDNIYVIDGDTIILDDDIRIRLIGLHVPELSTFCRSSRQAIFNKIYLAGKRLDCRFIG